MLLERSRDSFLLECNESLEYLFPFAANGTDMKKVKHKRSSSLQPLQVHEKKMPIRHKDQDQARSFVLKLWIENTSRNNKEINWRGHITEVISRKGRHVKSLDEVTAYLISQLREMGGKNSLP
jgi:hypothetical protein